MVQAENSIWISGTVASRELHSVVIKVLIILYGLRSQRYYTMYTYVFVNLQICSVHNMLTIIHIVVSIIVYENSHTTRNTRNCGSCVVVFWLTN